MVFSVLVWCPFSPTMHYNLHSVFASVLCLPVYCLLQIIVCCIPKYIFYVHSSTALNIKPFDPQEYFKWLKIPQKRSVKSHLNKSFIF